MIRTFSLVSLPTHYSFVMLTRAQNVYDSLIEDSLLSSKANKFGPFLSTWRPNHQKTLWLFDNTVHLEPVFLRIS